jgi:hypothetical protein
MAGRPDRVRTGQDGPRKTPAFSCGRPVDLPDNQAFFVQLLTLRAFPIYDVEELGLRG